MRKIETVISKSASVVDCAKRDFKTQGSEAAFAISICLKNTLDSLVITLLDLHSLLVAMEGSQNDHSLQIIKLTYLFDVGTEITQEIQELLIEIS
jgi:hypothetical protein